MFRTIGKNPPKNAGKFADSKSLNGKAHHLEVGTDNMFIGAKSSGHIHFPDYGVQERAKPIYPSLPQIKIGSGQNNYVSDIKHNFK